MHKPECNNAEKAFNHDLTESPLQKEASGFHMQRRWVLGVIDKGADFINRMPFEGKLLIKPVTLYAVGERDIIVREMRLVSAIGVIAYLAYLNTNIANRTLETTQQFINNQFNSDDPFMWARLGFYVTFAFGHYACVLAQTRLTTRLLPSLSKNTKRIASELSEWRQSHSLGSALLESLLPPNLFRSIFSKKEVAGIIGASVLIYGSNAVLRSL